MLDGDALADALLQANNLYITNYINLIITL